MFMLFVDHSFVGGIIHMISETWCLLLWWASHPLIFFESHEISSNIGSWSPMSRCLHIIDAYVHTWLKSDRSQTYYKHILPLRNIGKFLAGGFHLSTIWEGTSNRRSTGPRLACWVPAIPRAYRGTSGHTQELQRLHLRLRSVGTQRGVFQTWGV